MVEKNAAIKQRIALRQRSDGSDVIEFSGSADRCASSMRARAASRAREHARHQRLPFPLRRPPARTSRDVIDVRLRAPRNEHHRAVVVAIREAEAALADDGDDLRAVLEVVLCAEIEQRVAARGQRQRKNGALLHDESLQRHHVCRKSLRCGRAPRGSDRCRALRSPSRPCCTPESPILRALLLAAGFFADLRGLSGGCRDSVRPRLRNSESGDAAGSGFDWRHLPTRIVEVVACAEIAIHAGEIEAVLSESGLCIERPRRGRRHVAQAVASTRIRVRIGALRPPAAHRNRMTMIASNGWRCRMRISWPICIAIAGAILSRRFSSTLR